MVYKIKTHIFRYFEYGDIIYPINNSQQYAKQNAVAGDNCLSADIIKNNPEYFETIEEPTKALYDFVKMYNSAKKLRLID